MELKKIEKVKSKEREFYEKLIKNCENDIIYHKAKLEGAEVTLLAIKLTLKNYIK